MRNHGETPRPPASSSSPQVGTTSAQEREIGPLRRRVTDVDQLHSLPRLWEIQQENQMLTQILEIRETRIAALKRDIESGRYSIRAEQVAEKIMEDYLLDLFYS
jgi:anti-sigma28 factor (negative regulator of flagellin synthesis)